MQMNSAATASSLCDGMKEKTFKAYYKRPL